tara:strand:+ start:384 stop:986 length:603 start_codon:yes stop_codon:yes gene_type:complete
MNIYEKLRLIQDGLRAPKGKRNNFGKYNYRSCEDIFKALKPILTENECTVLATDKIIQIGDRYYVEATVTIINCQEPNEQISVTALAREAVTKKGMDDSQITGTASSYARKYACNGLFLIDDTKDADTDEYHRVTKPRKVTFCPTKYKPLLSLITKVTGSNTPGDYIDHLDNTYKLHNWKKADADRFIQKVKAGEISPFE